MYEPTLFCFVINSDLHKTVAHTIIDGVRRRLPDELLYVNAVENRTSIVQFAVHDMTQAQGNMLMDVSPIWVHPQNTSQPSWSNLLRAPYRWRVVIVSLCGDKTVYASDAMKKHFDGYFAKHFSNHELWSYDFVGLWNHSSAVTHSTNHYALELWVTENSPNWQNAIENILVSWASSDLRHSVAAHANSSHQHAWYIGAGSQVLDRTYIVHQLREYQKTNILTQLMTPSVTVENADASVQLANGYLRRYKEQFVATFKQSLASVESNIEFSYGATDNVAADRFVWKKNSQYIEGLFGNRWEWWMVRSNEVVAWWSQLFGLLRTQQERDELPAREEFVSKIQDLLRFVDTSARGSVNELEVTFRQFMRDAYADQRSGNGLRPIQRKLSDWHDKLDALDMFRYGDNQSVDRLPYVTGEILEDLAAELYQSFVNSVRKIRHRREQVYSFVGVLLRLAIAIPMLNGIIGGIFPPNITNVLLSLMPTVLLIIGGSFAVFSYVRYQRYSNKIREEFVHGKLGGILKSIMKYHFDDVRTAQLQRLRVINVSLTKIIDALGNDQGNNAMFVQRSIGVLLPREVLRQGISLENELDGNRVLVRKYQSVSGTVLQHIEARVDLSDAMRGLVGTDAWVFEYSPLQWQPALVSLVTSRLNLRAQRDDLYNGAYLYLKRLLDRLAEYDGWVPLSAREYIAELEVLINEAVVDTLRNNQYIDLQVFLSVQPQPVYGGSDRLNWLYLMATPAAQRYTTNDPQKEKVFLCMHTNSIGAIRGFASMHMHTNQNNQFKWQTNSQDITADAVVHHTDSEITCVRLFPVS
jgi:hypothetical protein